MRACRPLAIVVGVPVVMGMMVVTVVMPMVVVIVVPVRMVVPVRRFTVRIPSLDPGLTLAATTHRTHRSAPAFLERARAALLALADEAQPA